MYLFLDTTTNITVGVLDDKFRWLSYEYVLSNKSSSLVHAMINEQIEKCSTSLYELKGVFYCSGPGSYTGMRISQGIVDIFGWHKLEIKSFYHFDVPQLLGISEGAWISKAFKREAFVYRWSWESSESGLYQMTNLGLELGNVENIFFGHEEFDSYSGELTRDLIKNNSEEIFKSVLKLKEDKPLFYYRSLEEEYSKQ